MRGEGGPAVLLGWTVPVALGGPIVAWEGLFPREPKENVELAQSEGFQSIVAPEFGDDLHEGAVGLEVCFSEFGEVVGTSVMQEHFLHVVVVNWKRVGEVVVAIL